MHDLDLHGVARNHHAKRENQLPLIQSVFKNNEQKIIAKLAIYPGQQSVWLSAKNRYKVDWGDGDKQNYGSGAVANHIFNFDTLDIIVCEDGYKEVVVCITPQSRYNLTEINFDPQAPSEDVTYLGTANWTSIKISMPNLNSLILNSGKFKNRHPLLKECSVV